MGKHSSRGLEKQGVILGLLLTQCANLSKSLHLSGLSSSLKQRGWDSALGWVPSDEAFTLICHERDFPCKLYHTTGNCINGDDCMFSHDPLTEETRELLDKVISGANVAIADGNQEVPLPFLTWHCSAPGWPLSSARIPSCIDLEEMGSLFFSAGRVEVITRISSPAGAVFTGAAT